MDLQRLQVVITAKTQELQKQINQVVSKLQNINKASNDVEKGFVAIGSTGTKAMKQIIDASNQYLGTIKQIAQYNSKYDIWGGANSTQPWITSVNEIEESLKFAKKELES